MESAAGAYAASVPDPAVDERPGSAGLGQGPELSVRVLGCDGSWTGPGGAGSGYLVSSGPTHLVLDLGPGTFAQLQRHIDPASVTAVVITHRHPDHWTDLYPLATQARFALGREGIPVLSPAGLDRRAHLAGSASLDFQPVADGDSARIGTLDLTFHRTDHPVDTLAVRVDGGGRALGYSADTGPGWSLTQLGPGLDLVLCEASYTVEQEGTAGHMSGRQAGEQGRRAGVRRLVLTHRWPTVAATAVALEAEAAFGAPVEQAELGKEFVL